MMSFLKWQVKNSPKPYGWYWFIWLLILVAAAVLICLYLRKTSEKTNKKILVTVAIIMVFFEIIKQIVYSYNIGPTGAYWKFDFAIFPFHPSSVTMYVLIIALFLKEGKARNFFYMFLISFGLYGGLNGFIAPHNLFTKEYYVILFQTMLHHVLMFLVGFYLLMSGKVKITNKNFLKGMAVFFASAALALIFNVVFYWWFNAPINVFFISPYVECQIPVIAPIVNKAPWIIWASSFLLLYCLFAYTAMWAGFYLRKLIDRRAKTK